MGNLFKYHKTSPEIIRLAVLMYVRFPLSLRNVEDLLHERGIDISYETVRAWWNKLGLIFASNIRKKRVLNYRQYILEMAFARGVRQNKWRVPLFVASGESGR